MWWWHSDDVDDYNDDVDNYNNDVDDYKDDVVDYNNDVGDNHGDDGDDDVESERSQDAQRVGWAVSAPTASTSWSQSQRNMNNGQEIGGWRWWWSWWFYEK